MYKDGHEYYGTHGWYDSEDNDFCLDVIWKFEKGGDIPDSWHLQSVDLEDYSDSLPQALIEEVTLMCLNGGQIWLDIERDGIPSDLKEVSYN